MFVSSGFLLLLNEKYELGYTTKTIIEECCGNEN